MKILDFIVRPFPHWHHKRKLFENRRAFLFYRDAGVFYVYIIYSTKLNRYYVGYSIDLDKRMMDHNSGISKYTSKVTDWELKYFEKFETRQEAMKR